MKKKIQCDLCKRIKIISSWKNNKCVCGNIDIGKMTLLEYIKDGD